MAALTALVFVLLCE